MREIKFRGLTEKDGFAYGLLSHDLPNSTAYYATHSCRICWHRDEGGQSNVPVKNGTVGQFTGKKAKNGVDVYEGDIIDVLDGIGTKAVIVFDNETAAFCCDYMFDGGKSDHLYGIELCEVIGNIHENHDLLDKEQP